MHDVLEVRFVTDDEEKNRRLIDEYVLDAAERLPESPFCEYVGLMPFTHDVVDGSNVWVLFAGDSNRVLEHERVNFDGLVADGLATEWDATDITETWYETAGERGGELQLRLHRVAMATTKVVYEEFERPPGAVATYPNEASKHAIGWSTALHIATSHQEYSFEETLDAFAYGVEHTLDDIAKMDAPERAVEHLDARVESLETLREDLLDGNDSE